MYIYTYIYIYQIIFEQTELRYCRVYPYILRNVGVYQGRWGILGQQGIMVFGVTTGIKILGYYGTSVLV